jgi:hypothetical protein
MYVLICRYAGVFLFVCVYDPYIGRRYMYQAFTSGGTSLDDGIYIYTYTRTWLDGR